MGRMIEIVSTLCFGAAVLAALAVVVAELFLRRSRPAPQPPGPARQHSPWQAPLVAGGCLFGCMLFVGFAYGWPGFETVCWQAAYTPPLWTALLAWVDPAWQEGLCYAVSLMCYALCAVVWHNLVETAAGPYAAQRAAWLFCLAPFAGVLLMPGPFGLTLLLILLTVRAADRRQPVGVFVFGLLAVSNQPQAVCLAVLLAAMAARADQPLWPALRLQAPQPAQPWPDANAPHDPPADPPAPTWLPQAQGQGKTGGRAWLACAAGVLVLFGCVLYGLLGGWLQLPVFTPAPAWWLPADRLPAFFFSSLPLALGMVGTGMVVYSAGQRLSVPLKLYAGALALCPLILGGPAWVYVFNFPLCYALAGLPKTSSFHVAVGLSSMACGLLLITRLIYALY